VGVVIDSIDTPTLFVICVMIGIPALCYVIFKTLFWSLTVEGDEDYLDE